ncbi:MFS transporter [Streptomyces sp. NPDC005438]|uniref:MFS transporter n=1 Tax=Streptomyces sp. NPDC005438 TaxID=3156880 RepID=UPI0033AEB880
MSDARAASAPSPARQVIDAAGPSYFPLALVARFPYAMMVVGVLSLVVAARGSLALGGATSAAVGLGTALFGPLIGAAADRHGQRRVLLLTGVLSAAMLAAMTWVVASPLPGSAVLAVAFGIGATTPQVPPMSRSRLVGLITRRLPSSSRMRAMNGAMAYESAVDEVTFVFGPMIVGILAATLGAAAPVVGAAVLTLVAVGAFALHPSARAADAPASIEPEVGSVRDLFRPAMVIALAGVLGVGCLFGSVLTSLTALMDESGRAEQAGLVYGVMGVGSAALALLTGSFSPRFALRWRWLAFAGVAVGGAVALPLAGSLPAVVGALLVLGVGIGPVLVTLYSVLAQEAPRGRTATTMAMASTGIVVGQSAASALTGQLAQSHGTGAASLTPLAAILITAGAGLAYALTSPRPGGVKVTSAALTPHPATEGGARRESTLHS